MPDLRSELKRIKSELNNGGQEDSKRRGSESPSPEQRPQDVSPRQSLPDSSGRARPSPRLSLQPRSVPGNVASRPTVPQGVPRKEVAHRRAPHVGAISGNGRPGFPNQRAAAEPTVRNVSPVARVTPTVVAPVVRANTQRSPQGASEPNRRSSPVPTRFQPLPKGTPTRKGLFRPPADWLPAGGHTQCKSGVHRGAVDIVIGIDFGTSYTKAAVGFMDKVYPISWHGVSRCSPDYLLPSEYTQLPNGELYLGQHPDASPEDVHGDLKLPFLEAGVSSASISRAANFIALVLRYVRAWVYFHHASKLGHAKIRWQLNIGAPSNGLEQGGLKRAYRVLAATAWQRSIDTDPRRLAAAASAALHAGSIQSDVPDLIDLNVIPEFVAQMAGYMQSPQRQRGLHALVDVGGGTLDVVTFNVHQVDEEDTFPFLVPDVSSLGTHGLLQNRIGGHAARSPSEAIDELAPIESAAVFAQSAGMPEQQVIDRDNRFKAELRRTIKRVFDVTKSRRYRLSDAWVTGVRTFFTGGGSHVDLYREALQSTSVPSSGGLLIMPLPPHRNLDGFSGAIGEYQRISVACGLALDAFTLGRIVPAREVEDDRPVQRPRRDRPDRDELYPK